MAPEWATGRRYVYDAELSSSVAVSGAEMMKFSLRTGYVVEPRSTPTGYEFAARLVEPKFQVEDPEARAQFDGLARELVEPYGFSVSSGKLSTVRLRPDWSRFASSISRTLAGALQFVERPARQTGEAWVGTEVDPTGTYEVEYRALGDSQIAKRKLRYSEVFLGHVAPASFGAKLGPEVLESKGVLSLAPLGASERRLTRVDYNERLKTMLGPTSEVKSETKLSLVLKNDDGRPEIDWKALIASTKSMRPEQAHGAATPSSDFDAERIGSYTFASALRELEQQASDPKRKELFARAADPAPDPAELERRESKLQDHGRVFSAMAALLRRDPKNVSQALARIREGSKVSRPLLDALGSAGTSQAQTALVTVMNDQKLKASLRRDAAFSLMRLENAATATVSALEAQLGSDGPLRLYALYGLGSISRRLRDAGETERADAIATSLIKVLEAASTPGQQVNALRAIANSGSSAAFAVVRPFFASSATKVRAAAIDAIRLMPNPETEQIIVERLKGDSDEVQLAALDAIAVREPSPALAQALADAVKSSGRSGTRLKAVRVIGRWLGRQPQLRAALEAVAGADENEQVRRAARVALDGQGSVQFSKK